MPLDKAETYINDKVGKPVLDIGYGKEVPHAFKNLPIYEWA